MKTFTLMQATGEVVENAPVTTSEVAVETTTTQQDPASATETEQAQQGGSPWTMWIMLALIFGVMYFFMIRPQKKKEKEANEMRISLQIGDTVTTIGGITGIVNSLHEDEFILETSNDRTKICFKRWAIQEVKKLEM